jgi:RNA polymerase sigma-70 factor (ECF subfamily)
MDSTAQAPGISVSTGPEPAPIAATVDANPATAAVRPQLEPASGSSTGRLSAAELEAWFAAHFAEVYRYAYRLSGEHAAAEDLTQQTFTAALRHGGTVRSAEAVRSWLTKVCRHMFCRVLKRSGRVECELDTENLPARESRDGLELETRETLQTCIQALPEPFRVVVLMFYFEDASYREITDELGISVGTVMSRLSRAKALLRSAFPSTDTKKLAGKD